MRDYSCASGGLKVVAGSHRGDPAAFTGKALLSPAKVTRRIGSRDLEFFETTAPLVTVRSRPGDLVIWNLRSFHAAGARMFVDDPTLAVHEVIEDQLFAALPDLFAPPPGPRNAVFFDYGAPVEEVDLYIKHRLGFDALGVGRLLRYGFDSAELRALAARHGVALREDKIIQSLAQAVRAGQRTDAAALNLRLQDAIGRHREYSPYFPLIEPAKP